MNHEVFITCALTGAGDTSGKSDLIPVTPEQIAESGIQAAKAGAAVIHIHVRDPQSGAPARDPELYRQVVNRVRESGVNVLINLTAGMGGGSRAWSTRKTSSSGAGTDRHGKC